MIQLLEWPPQEYASFSVKGRVFEWKDEDAFVVFKNGTVDLDASADGFINRIQRYGVQNSIDSSEWDIQKIYFTILQKLPLQLRGKYFRMDPSSSLPPAKVMAKPNPQLQMSAIVNPHDAPIPTGLIEAARLENVAADDPDAPALLARQTPEQWLFTLKRWLAKDTLNRKSKKVAGPVWWYALHSVALNPSPSSTPIKFIGQWIGTFPCRLCRLGARVYMAGHPAPSWPLFAKWANDIHNYVTARK